MAYLRRIDRPKCARQGCTMFATHTLIDCHNGERGTYCVKHSTHALKRQEENESAAYKPSGGS